MDIQTLAIYYLIGVGITLAILYFLIKGAVKNGILEADEKRERSKIIFTNRKEIIPNSKQEALQNSYDNGDLTFQEYQTEWNKLK